jgi:diguanylate cyclase (GGDEF)-like protein/PAS domain S-box-containing protein
MSKETILIVDDEPANITIVAEILFDKYNIKIATNGVDALEILNKEKTDLILLDVIMPQMSGYELAYELKHNKFMSSIPFIFLTAKNDSKSIVEGFQYGAVDYISKPFAKEELLARVQTHLKIHKLQKSLANALEDVKEKNEEFMAIFNHSYNGIAVLDLNSNFLVVNDSYLRITGSTEEELLSKSCMDFTHPDDIAKTKEALERVLKIGYVENFEKRWIVNNKISYINTSITLMPDKKRLLLNIADVTALHESQQKIDHYVDLMDQNIISSSTDLDGTIINVSQAFCDVSGFTKDELIGKKHNIVKHPDMEKELYDVLWSTITQGDVWHGEIKNRKKDGTYYWAMLSIFPDFDENNQKIGYTAIRHDTTDKKRVEEISIKDDLTKLYNRRYFNEIVPQEINRAKRNNYHLAFIMLDVDHFKLYNDTYGHQKGDNVLEKIGEVLNTSTKRAGDYAFRLGGEEFGILFSVNSSQEVLVFANTIKEAIKALKIEHIHNSAMNLVTASLGLVYINYLENIDINSLYKNADDALYNAKENGRNCVVLFEESSD